MPSPPSPLSPPVRVASEPAPAIPAVAALDAPPAPPPACGWAFAGAPELPPFARQALEPRAFAAGTPSSASVAKRFVRIVQRKTTGPGPRSRRKVYRRLSSAASARGRSHRRAPLHSRHRTLARPGMSRQLRSSEHRRNPDRLPQIRRSCGIVGRASFLMPQLAGARGLRGCANGGPLALVFPKAVLALRAARGRGRRALRVTGKPLCDRFVVHPPNITRRSRTSQLIEPSLSSYDRLVLTGARSVGLPLARAARAQRQAASHQTSHQRPREHAFGEDRGRAGEAEHPRVGAPPAAKREILPRIRIPPPQMMPHFAGARGLLRSATAGNLYEVKLLVEVQDNSGKIAFTTAFVVA
jgi:hypothetical protein